MDTQKYLEYNAKVNLLTADGELQLEEDKKALQHFFQDRVNPNTVFFHTLAEKTDYMVNNGYWDKETVGLYDFLEFKKVFEKAYAYKFRFKSFVGALKFYTSFACKTSDGERFLERYEDRVAMVALYLARGDVPEALNYVELIITGKFQPATVMLCMAKNPLYECPGLRFVFAGAEHHHAFTVTKRMRMRDAAFG